MATLAVAFSFRGPAATPGSRAFGKRLACALHLPGKWLTECRSCRGTFARRRNHRYGRDAAVTVDCGHQLIPDNMRIRAPRDLVLVLDGPY